MKRVIERKNLAFNHMICICDLCKRWNGDFTESDLRVCKYNKDKKGLQSGLVINQLHNHKCKYYKRNQKYYTCKLMCKNYKTNRNKVDEHIVFKRGKFITFKI